MTRNCTQNDLVRFLYREMSVEEHLHLLEELQSDWEVLEEHNLLSEAKRQLPKVAFAPSTSTVNRILQYSRQQRIPAELN